MLGDNEITLRLSHPHHFHSALGRAGPGSSSVAIFLASDQLRERLLSFGVPMGLPIFVFTREIPFPPLFVCL